MDIPGASIGLPMVKANARAEIRGDISGGVVSVHLDIGACGCVGVWKLKKCWCNPTKWLPVNVFSGSYDGFKKLCPASNQQPAALLPASNQQPAALLSE
jgi:hypothetical protein